MVGWPCQQPKTLCAFPSRFLLGNGEKNRRMAKRLTNNDGLIRKGEAACEESRKKLLCAFCRLAAVSREGRQGPGRAWAGIGGNWLRAAEGAPPGTDLPSHSPRAPHPPHRGNGEREIHQVVTVCLCKIKVNEEDWYWLILGFGFVGVFGFILRKWLSRLAQSHLCG